MHCVLFLTCYPGISIRCWLMVHPGEVCRQGRHCYASCTDGMTGIRESWRELGSTEELKNRTEKSTVSSE